MRTPLVRCVAAIMTLVPLVACDRATPEQHVAQGREYVAKGDLRSAVIEFKNALQKEPNERDARFELGRVYLMLGGADSALKELERALDLGVEAERVLPPLLHAKVQVGRYQEVLGELDKLDGLSPQLLSVQGDALLRTGDRNRARQSFHDALSGDPSLGSAYVGLAALALADNDRSAARRILDDAAVKAPSDRAVWLARGDLSTTEARYEDAVADYGRAKDLPSGDSLGEAGIARARIAEGRFEEAEAIVDGILKQEPKWPIANYLKAFVALQRNDLDAAETALQNVQQVAPDHPPTMLLMATIKLQQKQYAQAETQASGFLSLNPMNVAARKVLAAARLARDDANGAVEALAPVAETLADAQSLALLGTAQLRSGKSSEATVTLERAAALAPQTAALRTQLALSLLASGESDGAVTQLETAVQLDDSVLQNEVLLVLVQLRQGKFTEAQESAVALTKKHPEDPIAFNMLGSAELGGKNVPAARTAFERALALDPAFVAAAVNLARLDIVEGMPAAARGRLESLLKAKPDSVDALLGLAEISLVSNDRRQAVEYLESARSRNPNSVAPRIALAQLALSARDLALADEVTEEALALAPDNPDCILLRVQVERLLRGPAAAVPLVNKLAERLSDDSMPAQALLALAAQQQAIGQVAQSEATYTRAAARLDDPTPARIGLLRAALARNDSERAAAELDTLMELEVRSDVLAVLEGDVAAARGSLEEAAKSYRRAADAGSREGTLKLQAVELRRGQPAAATKLLARWLDKHPEDVEVALAQANIQLVQNDSAGAMAAYERILQREPDNAVALNNLAWLYFDDRDARAEETARRAYAIAPSNPEVADTLGWILAQGDDAAEAVPILEQASAALSENGAVQYHLALAYERVGKAGEARRAAERALALGEFAERGEVERLLDRVARPAAPTND